MSPWIQSPFVIAAILAATVYGARFAKRHRRTAFAATSLLMLFGLNATANPPPPPRMEQVERDEEVEAEGEPK